MTFDLNKRVERIDDVLTMAWRTQYSEEIKAAKRALTELTEEYIRVRAEADMYRNVIKGD